MLHIFREVLDDAFREDAKLPWKLLAAAAVGAAIGVRVCFGLSNDGHAKGHLEFLCTTGAIAIVCVVVALLLSLKDVVKRRIREGKPVSLLLRFYLASGLLSFVFWMATVALGLALLVIYICQDC
jgi:hypothetical protein